MAAAFLAALQSDLRMLAVESQRKHPVVKDAAERAIFRLRSLTEDGGALAAAAAANKVGGGGADKQFDEAQVQEQWEAILAVTRSDEILRPFLLAAEAKSTKIMVIAMTMVQTLLSNNGLSAGALSMVVKTLSTHVGDDVDEGVQLKVLGVLLTLLTPSNCQLHGDALVQALAICFRMHCSKAPVIRNTAGFTIRQVSELLFERAQRDLEAEVDELASMDGSGGAATAAGVQAAAPVPMSMNAVAGEAHAATPHHHSTASIAAQAATARDPQVPYHATVNTDKVSLPSDMPPSAMDAYLFFQDLCLYMNGEPGAWLNVPRMSRKLGLELIESALDAHHRLFLKNSDFHGLVKDRVCSLLMRALNSKTEYAMLLRVLRLVTTIVRKFGVSLVTEYEIFLTSILKYIEDDTVRWRKMLALEVLRVFSSDAHLLRFLCATYDMQPNTTKVFELSMSAVSKTIQMALQQSNAKAKQSSASGRLDLPFPLPKSKGLELQGGSGTDGVDPPPVSDGVLIALGIDIIVSTTDAMASSALQAGGEDSAAGDVEVVRRMVSVSWSPCLAALADLLDRDFAEGVLQVVLKAYRSFTQTSGMVSMETPRDAFLTSLCKYALPPQVRREFSVASPDTAAVASLELSQRNILVLNVLFNIAHCLGSMLESAWHPILETFEHLDLIIRLQHADENSEVESDLTILSASLSRLFETSKFLDDDSLVHFMSALAVLSQKAIAQADSNKDKQSCLFGTTKLVETAMVNLARIERLWDSLIAHLSQVIQNPSPDVRRFACESLSKLVCAALSPERATFDSDMPSGPLPSDPSRRLSSLVDTITPAKMRANSVAGESSNALSPTSTRAASPHALSSAAVHDIQAAEAAAEAARQAKIAARKSQATASGSVTETDAEHEEALRHADAYRIFQRRILWPVNDIFFKSRHADVKESLLNALHDLLQPSGDFIQSGWPLIIQILDAAANEPEREVIAAAFKPMQLVCSDFLSALPPGCINACLMAISNFSMQQKDINISLSAIGLLWNVAGYMKKERETILERLGNETAFDDSMPYTPDTLHLLWTLDTPDTMLPEHVAVPSAPALDASASEKTLNNLWLNMFVQLQRLAKDVRPEVRHCALRTLISTLMTHGVVLHRLLWQSVLWKIMFPFLVYARAPQTAVTSGNVIEAELGKEHGKKVMMMVHHSRNTAEKQWDETRVLALTGLARVFKTFFGTLSDLPDFDRSWEVLLALVEDAVLGGSEEVAVAGTTIFEEVMQAQGDREMAFPRNCWTTALVVYDRITRQVALSPNTPARVQTALVDAFSALYDQLQACFTPHDVLRLLRILDTLIRIPSVGLDPETPAPLHARVLKLLKRVQPTEDRIWRRLLVQFMRYLPHTDFQPPLPEAGGQPTAEDEEYERLAASANPILGAMPSRDGGQVAAEAAAAEAAAAATLSPSQRRAAEEVKLLANFHVMHGVAFSEACMLALAEMYETPEAPDQVLADVLCDAIRIFSVSMKTRIDPAGSQSKLWYKAVRAFSRLLDAALARLGRVTLTNKDVMRRTLSYLVTSLREFLFSDSLMSAASGSEPLADQTSSLEEVDVLLVDTLASSVFPHVRDADLALQQALVNILVDGTAFSPALCRTQASKPRAKFAERCLSALVKLCHDDESDAHLDKSHLCRIALPGLLRRSAEVLHRFAEDEKVAGSRPLPADRLAEVSGLLKELVALRLPAHANLDDLQGLASHGDGTRLHLLRLFPHLSQCIGCSDANVRAELVSVFLLVSAELAIEPFPISA